MRLFGNLIDKIKSSNFVNYFSQQWMKPSKLQDEEKIKSSILEMLIKLDFQLELAKEVTNETIEKLKKLNSIDISVIKENLISSLIECYNSKNESSKNVEDNFNLNIVSDKTNVFFIVGSNGVGKTSSIAKLVYFLKKENYNKKILLVAGDTFRAGAVEQLSILAERLNVEIVTPREKETVNSLIYRVLKEMSRYDLIIFDSSGRQYNNQKLISEIQKNFKLVHKMLNRDPEETLLVLDSTLGKFSFEEVKKIFNILPITGIILTKMDHTVRGGVIYNLKTEFPTPIKFICYGEKEQDIQPFDITETTTQLVNATLQI
ncbi:P-loop NTPase family protein [Mycoplasma suis]|uniref:Signal recognition particle-docking protein FtsY n=2 Tax=Mycoplasma suis TaxID=57372 RepID=F0QS83_MYCSL|nr:cell division protein FtsY [Mycoplasma suis]ADX98353.1 signal recognition particle-docking protein FtsY [Mycoplasma suis str. Illinois]CBZ40862.1 Cell division protein FtsY [Mycoplasma suis KI3806]